MSGWTDRSLGWLVWVAPLLVLLLGWEAIGRNDPQAAFFFSYPSAILLDLATGFLGEGLWLETCYTMFPAAVGLLLGALVGGTIGFALVASPEAARRLGPLIAGLGAFPVFAIAPMTLVWFGLGIGAKVFLAFLGCVFVFLQATYNGGLSVPPRIISHMSVHGFGAGDQFLKVRLPFAVEWLTASFKTAANLALLGVFVGEFVASEHGLARVMLNAGAVYNVKRVLAAAVLFTAVALLFMAFANLVYALRRSVLRLVSVPTRVRD